MNERENGAGGIPGVHGGMREPNEPRWGDYVIRELVLVPQVDPTEDGIVLFSAKVFGGPLLGYHQTEVEALAQIWADARPRGKDSASKLRVWRENLVGETAGRLDPNFAALWLSRETEATRFPPTPGNSVGR